MTAERECSLAFREEPIDVSPDTAYREVAVLCRRLGLSPDRVAAEIDALPQSLQPDLEEIEQTIQSFVARLIAAENSGSEQPAS